MGANTDSFMKFNPIMAGLVNDVIPEPKSPALPAPSSEVDKEAEEARRREQERLRKGQSTTRKSGTLTEAFNATIARSTLGGA